MTQLLAVSLARHDGNITFFDGSNLHYLKLERLKQYKRFSYNNKWQWLYEFENFFNTKIAKVDQIIFDFHPETFFDINNLPQSIRSVLSGKQNVIELKDEENIFSSLVPNKKIFYCGHHYAHSLSSWMLVDDYPSVNVVIDGIGDRRTWSIFRDDKLVSNGISTNGSIGQLTGEMGRSLGIQASNGNDLAGKLMALQTYGNVDELFLKYLKKFNINYIKDIFNFQNWIDHKGDSLVANLTKLDWAKTVHTRVGEVIVELLKYYIDKNESFTYSGGVAQNVVWNTTIRNEFKNVIIPPHSSDEGLTLGSIEWLRRRNNIPRFSMSNFPFVQRDICPQTTISHDTLLQTAKLLADGKIIAWYQDNGEVGPRALGNRSIFMDPRIPNGKQVINKVKNRELYRPFGATVLESHSNEYFEDCHDPFMLHTSKLKVDGFDSIKHVDGTCRVQTANSKSNVGKLLELFYNITNCPILLNTSLNVASKPIAGYPEIAIDLLKTTCIDYAVVGDKIYNKLGLVN